MGSSCGCCRSGDGQGTFQRGGDKDLSNGPVKNRGCTDPFCIPVFLAAQVTFIIVTIWGFADGNPTKLYKPRDFQGAYCGVQENWNNGPNTEAQTRLSYTMNVTSMSEVVMKQLVCSSWSQKALLNGDSSNAPLLMNQTEKDKYLCSCCLAPCASCTGALNNGGDLDSPARITEIITARMKELTDPSLAKDLFSPAGNNGQLFSTDAFWNEATRYMNLVCLPSCDINAGYLNETSIMRKYTYEPPMDHDLYFAWTAMKDAETNALTEAFRVEASQRFDFTAYPEDVCPYPAQMCVPMPGMTFQEMGVASQYCTFGMTAQVIGAVGDVAASAFESLGLDSITNAAGESFGKWVGDFQQAFDTFIIVSVLSFVVGLLFIITLRFVIGCCVWIAVACTVLMFFFGGGILFVLSAQCDGAGLLESGHQQIRAIIVAGGHAISGGSDVSEELKDDGANYRGRQQSTINGKSCLPWDGTRRYLTNYNSAEYPDTLSPPNETRNYCRNPYHVNDTIKARTIWCVTSDPMVQWEECLPVGVIQPECARGYQVSGKSARDALFYSSFVVWGLGGLWMILVMCFIQRIRLAIALNKVAAVYLSTNPSTLLIPIVQAVAAVLWISTWFYCASFLLSQVPADYTPTGYFATYAEAFGVGSDCAFWEFGDHCKGTPGKCTDKWPTGSVWKDSDCDVSDPSDPKCWRCAPPRYVFDWRFAVSFFVFLWNNAFNVALGQMLIAMAVGLWFFSANKATTFVVKQGVGVVFRYHIGTVALGSFIVAVVQFIRYVMKFFEKQAAAQKNRVMALVLRCLQCCIWCFEKCIKYLNKNAYIQTALLGTWFCTSAKNAFWLIARNMLRFGTMAVLGSIISAIGFITIMASTSVGGYFLMKQMHPDIAPLMPIILFCIVSYVVAKLYMNVFNLAVDTSLQCFLAVEEMGCGAEYIPNVLKKFVDTSTRKLANPRPNGVDLD